MIESFPIETCFSKPNLAAHAISANSAMWWQTSNLSACETLRVGIFDQHDDEHLVTKDTKFSTAGSKPNGLLAKSCQHSPALSRTLQHSPALSSTLAGTCSTLQHPTAALIYLDIRIFYPAGGVMRQQNRHSNSFVFFTYLDINEKPANLFPCECYARAM